ncbi:MAG: alkaline phosphatase D family protein [Hyphomicrobiaceae bacterium]
MTTSRRELMRWALHIAAATASLPAPLLAQPAASAPKADPFAMLGVASGDPTATGVVLWCRLALDLADTERWGLGANAYRVTWEVRPADKPNAPPLRAGSAIAAREKGYAVHVEVTGLAPAQSYAFRFRLGAFEASGLTRTAPRPDVMTDKLRFAACSCAEFEYELYYVYDKIADEKPDFIVHLGDYIYEETYDRFFKPDKDPRSRRLRFDRDAPLTTLAQYRRRYAEHKSDPMLQRAHAAAPWIVTWDDHEVANDYAGGNSADRDETGFLARRIAAYRAYFENMPIRLSTLPVREGRRQLYRHLSFGRLLGLSMLDERQYRDPQACRFDNLPGGKNVGLTDCPQLTSNRTILGTAQERWFEGVLTRSPARWSIIAQGVMFSHLETRRDPRLKGQRTDPHMWSDTWSGYLPARQRMIDLLARHKQKNPVLLSGDIHSHFVNRVFRDWKQPGIDPVATEFVCASVSSFVRDLTPIVSDDANKNVVAFYDNASHGYIMCEVTPSAFEATMVRITDKDRATKTAKADRSVRFRVETGKPEPVRVG